MASETPALKTDNPPVDFSLEFSDSPNATKQKVSEAVALNFPALLTARKHTLSADLPLDTDLKEKWSKFKGFGKENLAADGYEGRTENTSKFDHIPELKKFDFGEKNEPNVGWKVHLNVSPKNALEVAKYLTNNGYYHKFLKGGEPGDGKIFTIYLGSRAMADKWAHQISQDLKEKLQKPLDTSEVELARGVVGRFAIRAGDMENKYTGYGTCGMPFIKQDALAFMRSNRTITNWGELYEKSLGDSDLEKIFLELKKDFGAYFTG